MNPLARGDAQFRVTTLTGRLTSPPVAVATNGGTQITSLRLAVPPPPTDGNDQGADFVEVTVFGRQAQACAAHLGKGRRIAIDGRLHHSEWDGDDGRRQKLEVIAERVEFLDAPREEQPQPAGVGAEQEAAA
ncbi:MAG TPA: single-stranded DNA-binding protein [Solirubrobacteraceae bacterium]|jgi:single-strand DNA-binding protein